MTDRFDLREPRRSKPVVVGSRGITVTVGVELTMAADVAIAGSDIRMNQIEEKCGIMATGEPTIRMVERAGWGNVMCRLLTGDEFGAEDALRMNLITQIVAPDAVTAAAIDITHPIAQAAPLAVMATRRNAMIALEHGRTAAIAEFDDVNRRLSQTEDAVEGVAAFREKREPRFRGR